MLTPVKERLQDMRPQCVWVTGASGFIGGWIWRRLVAEGCDAWGIGRRQVDGPNYRSISLGGTDESLASLGDRHRLPPPDVIVHAAARSSPWGSRHEFQRDNVRATEQVISFAEEAPATRVIFISSSSVLYRAGHQWELSEETPLAERPLNHYAATKQVCEQRVATLGDRGVILRPRAVFGPGDTVLLPRILEAARAGRLPWIRETEPVIGDLVYVENLVDVVLRSVDDANIHGLFHVTNQEPVDVREFLSAVFDELGIALPKRQVARRTAMMAAAGLELFHKLLRPRIEPPITRFGVHVFAYSKTFAPEKQLTTFGPPRVSLAEGRERTVRYFRELANNVS